MSMPRDELRTQGSDVILDPNCFGCCLVSIAEQFLHGLHQTEMGIVYLYQRLVRIHAGK